MIFRAVPIVLAFVAAEPTVADEPLAYPFFAGR